MLNDGLKSISPDDAFADHIKPPIRAEVRATGAREKQRAHSNLRSSVPQVVDQEIVAQDEQTFLKQQQALLGRPVDESRRACVHHATGGFFLVERSLTVPQLFYSSGLTASMRSAAANAERTSSIGTTRRASLLGKAAESVAPTPAKPAAGATAASSSAAAVLSPVTPGPTTAAPTAAAAAAAAATSVHWKNSV